MIYLSLRAKLWAWTVTMLAVAALIFGAMLVYTQLFIIYGTQKEKANKQCVDPIAIEEWNKALLLATTACDDARALKLGIQNKEIENLTAEVEQWKGNYSWLKRQQAEVLIIKP